MANKAINITKSVINSVTIGNIFDTSTSKFMVTALDKDTDAITITELAPISKMNVKTKTFTNPKTGETFTKTINEPVLTTSVRNMKLSVFAALVDKKIFEPTPFAYIEKHFGAGHEINRFIVKETVKFF